MALMDEQYFSQVFRQRYPKFNGLIWAYHWLQVGLYEPLPGRPNARGAEGGGASNRGTLLVHARGSARPVADGHADDVGGRAQFQRGTPRAAVIFDNLHMMHDIISDILTADTIPHERKREVIYHSSTSCEIRRRT